MPDMWSTTGSAGLTGDRGVILLDYDADVPDGTGVGTIIYYKKPEPTVWDFTGLSALPDGWTQRGAINSQSFDPGGLTFTADAGEGYQVDLPGHIDGTGPMTVEAAFTAGQHASRMLGVQLANGSGLGAQAGFYDGPAGVLAEAINAWTYNSNFQVNGSVSPAYPARFRLRRNALGQYHGSVSFDDGATWSAETAALTSASTISRLGIGSALGTITATLVEVTIAGGGGGVQGWWDGTQIQPFT